MITTMNGRLLIDAYQLAVTQTEAIVRRRQQEDVLVSEGDLDCLFSNFFGKELYRVSGLLGKNNIRQILNKVQHYREGRVSFGNLYRNSNLLESDVAIINELLDHQQQATGYYFRNKPLGNFTFTTQF